MYAKDQAERAAERHVQDGMDENLPGDENDEDDQSEWNWEAMAKMANARWGLSLRDRDLKKLGRDHVGEFLIEKARESIEKVDLSEGKVFLDEDFPQRTIVGWAHAQVRPRSRRWTKSKSATPAALKTYVKEQVRGGLRPKGSRVSGDGGHLPLYAAAKGRRPGSTAKGSSPGPASGLARDLDVESLKNKQRDEIRAVLVEHSREAQQQGRDGDRRGAPAAGPAVRRRGSRPHGPRRRRRQRPARFALDVARAIVQLQADRRRDRRARPRRAGAAAARRRSTTAIAPKCGGWSGCCSCRSSIRPGKTTCW